jgi:MFS family permease
MESFKRANRNLGIVTDPDHRTGTSSSSPPSRLYFFFLVAFLILNEIYDTYTTQYPSIIVDLVESDFAINSQQYAFYLGFITLGSYFVFISQFIADRIGRKPMLFITLFGMGFASVCLGFAADMFQYSVAAFFLYVFFSSDIWTMVVSEESPKERRGWYVNLILVGGCIGALLVPLMFDFLVAGSGFSWRSMTWFAAIAIGLAFITMAFKETRAFLLLKQARAAQAPAITGTALNRLLADLGKPFNREIRARSITVILLGFIIGLNYLFILMGKDFLTNVRHLSQGDAADVVLLMGIAAIVGYLVNGVLIDKLGRKKILLLFGIMFPASIIITILGNTAMIYIGAMLVSASFWNLGITSRIFTLELSPTGIRGQMAGWRSLFFAAGTTASAFIASMLLQVTDLGIIFIILSLCLVVFIPVLLKFLPETKGIDMSTML